MVEYLAYGLAYLFGGCNIDYSICTTVTNGETAAGMKRYFNMHGFAEYEFYMSPINDTVDGVPITITANEWTDYIELIKTGNPAIIAIGEEEYGIGHMVFGVGYIETMSTYSTGFLVHDNISPGLTWISREFVNYFGFVYEQ